ncbi:hypothetical protein MNBD_GAMMA22-1963 [hydrothermal vent metagenome]|uniref:TonB C-terminal domain-containing protein n=1 Tax=hydrothermal vent metagenome TaxID=652676 RepID=A0A3B1A6S8_9ZZZZ
MRKNYIVTEFDLLPWDISREESTRFNKILLATFSLFIIMFFVGLFINKPEVKTHTFEPIPQRIAQLLIKKKPDEFISNVKRKKILTPKSKFKIEKKQIIKKLALKKEKISKKAIQKAQKNAAKAGIVALSDELSALRDMASVKAIGGKLHKSLGRVENKSKDLINEIAKSGSGSIENTKHIFKSNTNLKNTGVVAISKPIDSVTADSATMQQRQRSKEDIALVFDRYKSSFYSLYRRATRKKLGLQGRVIFRIKILPNGSVSQCSIVSSDLQYPALENKLLRRIKLMNFGAKDVIIWLDNFHIDFTT